MKTYKLFSLFIVLALAAGGFSPVAAMPAQQGSGPAGPQSPEAVPVLACNGTGITSDLADTRGVVFTVSQPFRYVELRFVGAQAGPFTLTAELRRSSGFTGSAAANVTVSNVSLPGLTTSGPPYKPVRFDLGNVAVSAATTFSLRFVNISGPGSLYFETFGIGNKPCANVMETDENNIASPTERGDPAGFKALAPDPSSLALNSIWVNNPPQIDGSLGFNEWNNASNIPFDNGFITVVNDDLRLYVLLDVLGETTDNASSGDYFWLSFDVDKNNAITANTDKLYGLAPGAARNIRYSFYLGPSSFTGVQPNTYSSRGVGFGCFFGDGTLSFTSFFPFPRITCNRHRVWELAIDLSEISANAGGTARMGVRVNASSPAFTNDVPVNQSSDFSNLITVNLAPAPFFTLAPFSGAIAGLDTNPVEVTQAVQHRDNTLPLVAGKDTVARVYASTRNVAFPMNTRVYLYGSQGGTDLPGSPLAAWKRAPTVINRNNLNDTTNFALPKGWNTGSVTFQAKTLDQLGQAASAGAFTLAFTPKSTPTYWVVPLNTGTAGAPVLPVSSEIPLQESYLKAIYPLSNVNFVTKDWTAVGVTSEGNSISDLNHYYNNVVIAWLFTVIFTGKAPFTLPDQIYGMLPTGGGLSDPVWAGGAGRVARGFEGTSLEGTMAHEINHNLDRSNNGTWGRHVPNGCGAAGPDPSWPYTTPGVHEVGFDTRSPWSVGPSPITVQGVNTPDIMSYCQSGRVPTKWISDYRWNALFGNFTTALNTRMLAAAPDVQTLLYVTGAIHKDGSASMDPIIIGPGNPSPQLQKTGAYTIEVKLASGATVSQFPFDIEFLDDPEEPVNTVHYNFQIPIRQLPGRAALSALAPFNPDAGEQVVLVHNGSTIASRIASSNAPQVTWVMPTAGASLTGTVNIRWNGTDADSDPLTYSLYYSQTAWLPLSAGLITSTYSLNTALLPPGSNARLRVTASDGFNNVTADSPVFTVQAGAQAPQVTIQQPASKTIVPPDGTFLLAGDAYDPVDGGSIPDDSFVWTDESNHILGSGRSLPTSLPFGHHTLTLTVTNSLGKSSQASITVNSALPTYVPFLSR